MSAEFFQVKDTKKSDQIINIKKIVRVGKKTKKVWQAILTAGAPVELDPEEAERLIDLLLKKPKPQSQSTEEPIVLLPGRHG